MEILLENTSVRKRGNIEGEACEKGKGLKMKHTILGDHCDWGKSEAEMDNEPCVYWSGVCAERLYYLCQLQHRENCTLEKIRSPGTTFEDGEKCSNEDIGQFLIHYGAGGSLN